MTIPIPDQAAELHSAEVTAYIREIMAENHGILSFARFMELALYAPGLGYYSAGTHKFGRGGDFITAPEISPLFAQCIARQCEQVFNTLEIYDILELGAGSGVFAKDLLLELEKLNKLPTHYYILEVSAELRARQKAFLQTTCSHLYPRVHWLDTLPENLQGVIFANEVMDAMPVHCFKVAETIYERCVSWNEDHFAWQLRKAPSDLRSAVQTLQQECPLPYGYQSEINLALPGWIRALSATLTRGLILLIDYGYGRREYYHPDRAHGTLTGFYQHQRVENPFLRIGLQDMTAHVDFTTVIENAAESKLTLQGYTTQAAFLLSCGIIALAEQAPGDTIEQYQRNQAIKTLTLPSEMGEIVKVMALGKQLPCNLLGFTLQDRRRDL